MSKLLRVSLLAASIACAFVCAPAARAAQTTITISTAAPPAAPRVQPPLVIGAIPATPFLYAIPATGQAPLSFSATGLPSGLTVASSSGIISGTAPAAGSYSIAVTVANGSGSAMATLTLVSGTMLRPTPPMGWNSYDSYGASVTQSEVIAQAQALRTTLQPFGWNTVIIDYRWYDPEDTIDSNGRYLPSISKYPSATGTNGLKTVADQVHALGLGFGIHIMRGIPRTAVTANSPIANATYHASDAANTSDACPWDQHMWGVNGSTAAGQAWYDALFAQYAQWGIDFVKIDDMLNNTTKVYHQAEADAIRKAVNKSGRAIVLSFSPGADDPTWLPSAVADLNADADMWRVVDDFWDYKAITDLPGVFTAAGTWQASTGLVAGHWPDTDMLPLGYLGPRCEWHASGETTFTHNDQVTILSLWSILPSPLIFGGNVQSLTTDATTGPWTVALLGNEEVLAVNQDSLGTHAKRIVQQGTTEIWARDLSGGRKAVALFNRDTQDATISVSFSQLSVSGTPAVRDLWNRTDVTGVTTGISVSVPYGAAMMYVLSPSSTGAGGGGGGSGGAAGRAGTAGATGAGGAGGIGGAATGTGGVGGRAGSSATGTGGGSGLGGSAGRGGSGPGGKSGSGGATGGTTGDGGTMGAGGAAGGAQTGGTSGGAGASVGGSDSSSGCACNVGAGDPGEVFAFVLLGASLFVRRRNGHEPMILRIPFRPRVAAAALCAALAFASFAAGADTPRITSYRNPVLPGVHPDPSVVRVGEWFYLVNSSFEMFPGVPIHRSRDLVHWEPLGCVLTRDSQLPLGTAKPSGGIFAPTIRYHAGTYYMITTNVSQGGTFFVTAKDPAGPWSEPIWLKGPDGIDPSLFFDDDGKVYLTSTGSAPGIYQAQIDVASGKLLTPPRVVWKGTGGRYPEGPHLYKVAGRYYLMISEGGTEYGHMVTIARAGSPWGPFEPCPRNPILTHRDTPLSEPIQATGHADLVEDAEGNWWMVFLGIRPQGGYYWHHLGRETFLAPVRWDAQGWPVINEGKPIALDMQVPGLPAHATPIPPVRDDFDGPLGPAWNFLRNPVRASSSTTERRGWLTLHGTAVTFDQADGVSPTFVGRRQEHLRARIAARIDFVPAREGQEAGLVLYRAPQQRYEIGVRRNGGHREVFVRQTLGAYVSTVTASAAAPGNAPLVLQIEAEPNRYTFAWGPSPDRSDVGTRTRLQPMGAAETRLLSTEVTGGFIGTYVGMYALAPSGDPSPAPAAFDWFDYEKRE